MLMDKKHCNGCYNDEYNRGLGGAKECWGLETAKLISRKEVSIHQHPPWNQKPRRFPSCYQRSGFVYVEKDRTC